MDIQLTDPQQLCVCNHLKQEHRLPYREDCMKCTCEQFVPIQIGPTNPKPDA